MLHATTLRPRISFRHEALWMRLTARAVLSGWLLPLLFALFVAFAPAPARAQDASAPRPKVVVLDFATPGGVDPLLGRKMADALVVELQRSAGYDVVTRQDLQTAVGQQAGLAPPFNDTAQQKLAQAVGAASIFSGQITRVDVVPGQVARVGVVVRQLEAVSGDYINGTQNIESTEQKLTPVANEILIDEAINKVAFSAVRSLRQTTLPFGSVLNTTANDLELSIGSRNGVGPGQRYSVLRDVLNTATGVTERVKVGEIAVRRVDADQATAVVVAGAAAGVRTGDFVREIYQAPRTPLYLTNGNSSTPVTAAPVNLSNRTGLAQSKLGKGALGLLGLFALVGLVGFGGGGGNPAPSVGQPVESNPYGLFPQPSVQFSNGFSGIGAGLQGEAVVGYIVYRGTSANFAATVDTIQGFIDARNVAPGTLSFTEPIIPNGFTTGLTRTVLIQSNQNNGNNNNGANQSGGTGATVDVTITNTSSSSAFVVNAFTQTQTAIQFTFTQQPLQIGQQYFYKVQRVSAERVTAINNGNTGNNNGNTNGNTNTTSVNLLPFRSPSSGSTGGYTPLLRPLVTLTAPDSTGISYDLANFSVRVNSQLDITQMINQGAATTNTFFFGFNNSYFVPVGTTVTSGANDFQVSVATTQNALFSQGSSFVSRDFSSPTVFDQGSGDAIFSFDAGTGDNGITVPGYVIGQTPIFIQVRSRNTSDANVNWRYSPVLFVPASSVKNSNSTAQGVKRSTSRFVVSNQKGLGIRFGTDGGSTGALTSPTMPHTHVGHAR